MRLLMAGRLFGGLADGAARAAWEPRGVPAFTKLVEALHADPSVQLLTLLACKDPDARFTSRMRFDTEEAGTILVLPYYQPTGGRFRKIDRLITEIRHLNAFLTAVRQHKADLVYATYAMVVPAGIYARLSVVPVILRLMGLFPQHRQIARGEGFKIFGWALRSPFRHVICTEDGSDPSRLLPKVTAKGTPITVRLNGCDVAVRSETGLENDGPLRVTFLNRLEPYKGAPEFVNAAISLASELPGRFRFSIVGDGSLYSDLKVTADHPDIIFTGAIPHKQALETLRKSDICVSVNMHGNLSNANLEALASGCCLVIPSSDPSVPIDTSTDDLLPGDVVLRYERSDPSAAIAGLLRDLEQDRTRVSNLRTGSLDLANRILKPWTETVAADIRMLKETACSEDDAHAAAPPHSHVAQSHGNTKES